MRYVAHAISSWDSTNKSSEQMHFCLADPDRQSGPLTWQYVEGDEIAECATDTLTLTASAAEAWKAFSDDRVVVGSEVVVGTGQERFISVADKLRLQELGDDLAEEGARMRPMREVV